MGSLAQEFENSYNPVGVWGLPAGGPNGTPHASIEDAEEREREGSLMTSYTLENVFILTVFQLLVAGLILCSTCASLYLQKEPSVRKILKLLVLAFTLYSTHFFLEAGVHYRNLSVSTPAALSREWGFLADSTEMLAFVCLALAYLPSKLAEKLEGKLRWVVPARMLLLVTCFYSLQQWQMDVYGRAVVTSLLNGALLAGVALAHLRARGRKGLFPEAPLYILALAQFLHVAMQEPATPEWLWIAQQAATLVGLGLFAVVADARTRNLQVRFFLRLNLTFVALATLLILTVAETERREYLSLAENHAEGLSEFLRGHVIYFHRRGVKPAEILSNPEIIRRITADFGYLADLRRVRIRFEDWHMEMELHEDWTISQEVHYGPVASRAPRPGERGRVVTLPPVPIRYNETSIGQIELDQGLRTINLRVARQMRIIFLTFTVAVFIAALLFGLTVQRANKTIQTQFEELEKTHTQLAHVERLATVGQLAGGLAHEINNPAGIIITTSEFALRQMEKDGSNVGLREDFEAVRRQARRISNIVSSLLTFSRPTLLQKRLVDVNEVLRPCLDFLAPRFREQRIQLEQRLGENLPRITADPDRLEQVFVNLLNNAADAMPQGGTITVESSSVRERGQHVVLSFADTGCGIPEDQIPKIFDPFFTTKPKGKGTGLGLSVSYGIIRDHGGKIEVESQPNHGTVFQVRLPSEETRHEGL